MNERTPDRMDARHVTLSVAAADYTLTSAQQIITPKRPKQDPKPILTGRHFRISFWDSLSKGMVQHAVLRNMVSRKFWRFHPVIGDNREVFRLFRNIGSGYAPISYGIRQKLSGTALRIFGCEQAVANVRTAIDRARKRFIQISLKIIWVIAR